MPRILLLLLLCAAAAAAGPAATSGEKKLPLPGDALRFEGHDAFVILPPGLRQPASWVWSAPTLPGLPGKQETWMFGRFLKAGIAGVLEN